MRTTLLYAILAFSLLLLSGCEAIPAAAATLEPIALAQPVPAELADEYSAYQAIFDAAYLPQSLFHKYDDILIHWPDSFVGKQEITLRIQRGDGRIYSERMAWVKAGEVINLGEAYVFPNGDYFVVLMPTPGVYYEKGVRVERRIPIQLAARQ